MRPLKSGFRIRTPSPPNNDMHYGAHDKIERIDIIAYLKQLSIDSPTKPAKNMGSLFSSVYFCVLSGSFFITLAGFATNTATNLANLGQTICPRRASYKGFYSAS